MGTNFYARITHSTCGHCGHTPSPAEYEFHLGKLSAGWPFLRHADPAWPIYEAFDRWIDIINSVSANGGVIVDEHGMTYERDTMIQLADDHDKIASRHRVFAKQWIDYDGRYWSTEDFC